MQNYAASLTTYDGIDMSSLMDLHKKYKDEVPKEHNGRLEFMNAFARAYTLALCEIPAGNALIKGHG
ncbi:Dihydrolipoyllysine-residue succinyltransferase component of 2-oxoglutarate dehydrogenase complex, mitochondrial [Hygrophoropsis aurantiaca]|uniref:Dihydrolipoyllysine-residue succinyltransferase component of 2-oxoglutarate dehydrogenase complex, mitochondrial n=1 Tax=Hygrophoropsis aurantiaca TaxID=72124 RepID=A0ACB7ZVC8_9AGAM|nr:Dihydrolipoyllysine-residue succinyltransferase component of 2-oxoglutarate dehydrogenase complex, mitochondrial [Hygrophoropsis aurantiaca]